MATITGLKLSELSTLALGSTGTLFYAASAASNSYKMYEKDLYNTINRLHISGDYQPKIEDWRFVHKTGNERITGEKTFVNNIILTNTSSLQVEDLIIDSYGNLVSNLNDNFISLQSGTIGQYNASPQISIDINNRVLSGNWYTQRFSPTGIYGRADSSKYIDLNNYGISGNWGGVINSGYANSFLVHRNGNESITGDKTFVGSVNIFPQSLYVDNVLSYTDNTKTFSLVDTTFYSPSPTLSMNWGFRALYDTSDNLTLNWNTKTLSGNWNVENLNSNKSISGNLLSGNRLVSKIIHSSGLYSRLITGKVAYIDEFYLNEDAEHTFHNDITFDNVGLGQQTAIFGIDGSIEINKGIGFWGSGTPQGRPVITGSRGANVALASLLTGLHYMGIIDNRTTI